jgi:hypothetical protein
MPLLRVFFDMGKASGNWFGRHADENFSRFAYAIFDYVTLSIIKSCYRDFLRKIDDR